jgi:hypothetical protein
MGDPTHNNTKHLNGPGRWSMTSHSSQQESHVNAIIQQICVGVRSHSSSARQNIIINTPRSVTSALENTTFIISSKLQREQNFKLPAQNSVPQGHCQGQSVKPLSRPVRKAIIEASP